MLRVSWTKHIHIYIFIYKHTYTRIFMCCLLLLAAYGFPFQHSAFICTLTYTYIYIYAHSQLYFAPTDAHNFPQIHTLAYTYTRRHAHAHRACKRSIACNENGRNLASRLPPLPSLLSLPSLPLRPTLLPSSNHAVCSIHTYTACFVSACVCHFAKMLEIVPANKHPQLQLQLWCNKRNACCVGVDVAVNVGVGCAEC